MLNAPATRRVGVGLKGREVFQLSKLVKGGRIPDPGFQGGPACNKDDCDIRWLYVVRKCVWMLRLNP